MNRVGILGGSFNPPHIGHLICARLAAEQLGLEKVFLVPLNEPSHRTLESDPGASARLELCRLAVAEDPLLDVSDQEVARGGVSYTVETLEHLSAALVADGIVLILGADAALGLGTWKEPARILELASVAVTPRPGTEPDAADEVRALFPEARVESFTMPAIGISSSELRARLARGLSIRDMVPAAVEEKVAAEGWYREGNPS